MYITEYILFLDSATAEHAEEVDAGLRPGDREDEADAGAPQHQLLQASPNIRSS